MMAFKGVCSICKQKLTVFSPGFVCFDCEKFTHGDCLNPPMGVSDMNAVVIKTRLWLCQRCKDIRGKEFVEDVRPDKESREIKKKIEAINEIRELLTRIEKALDDTTNECERLTEKAKRMQKENLDLRIRMLTYTKGQGVTLFRINPNDKPANEQRLNFPAKKMTLKNLESTDKTQINKSEKENIIKDFKKHTFKHHLGLGERLVFYLQESLTNVSKGWALQAILIILVLLYTLIGALIFTLIEGIYEKQLLQEIFDRRLEIVQKLVQAHKNGGNVEETAKIELDSYYDFLIDMYKINNKLLQPGDDINWNYLGSIFFCGITYTTIGFGYFVPVTDLGKIVVIFYTLFGIPLFLALMASLGTTMSNILKYQWNTCKKSILWIICCRKRRLKSSVGTVEGSTDYDSHIPVPVVLVVEVIYLIIGAFIFMSGEVWTFAESFYFVFISLTIGFGDYFPSNIGYMMAVFAYIVIGLALTSMSIAIISEKIVTTFEKATEKLGTNIEHYLHDQFLADVYEEK